MDENEVNKNDDARGKLEARKNSLDPGSSDSEHTINSLSDLIDCINRAAYRRQIGGRRSSTYLHASKARN